MSVLTESPALAGLRTLVEEVGDKGCSDFHIHPEQATRVVNQGNLTMLDMDSAIYSNHDLGEWMLDLTAPRDAVETPEQRRARRRTLFRGKGHLHLSLDVGLYRARLSFRRSADGVSLSGRLIPSEPPTARDVQVPQIVSELSRRPSGLIVYVGPTGSGKTTSIAALINDLNAGQDKKHIYCIEDPIEYVHSPVGASVITQRQIGDHAPDYPTAIQDALRSLPNVIVVGELLDPQTVKTALHAATTGHLVLTTSHAGSASEAISNLIGQCAADEQPQIRTRLADTLLACVVQQLVPTELGPLTPAHELLVNGRNVADIIRQPGEMHRLSQQLYSAPHCHTMEQSLASLVREGHISADTARSRAKDAQDIERELAAIR